MKKNESKMIDYLQYISLIDVLFCYVRHKVRGLEETQKKFIHQLQRQHNNWLFTQRKINCKLYFVTKNKTLHFL